MSHEWRDYNKGNETVKHLSMEESSEKRRERLQAMRMEAAQSDVVTTQNTPSTVSGHLSNPLIHPSHATPAPTVENSPPFPRFDYYTDPMSAFSGSKRNASSGHYPSDNFSSSNYSTSPMSRPTSSLSAGPRSFHMTTFNAPAHQFQMNPSPDQNVHEMPFHVPQTGPWRSPVRFASPFSGQRGTPVSGPNAWNRSGGSSGYGLPPSSSRGGFTSPGFGRGDNPSPRSSFGRGGSPLSNPGRDSPSSNTGRGKNWRFGSSPGPSPRWSGGGGRGPHSQQFYIKAMIKDPWRKLKPVVGNILVPRFWLPKSLTVKKPKVITESGNKFSSQPSLAECLALSFEEAANDVTNNV